MERLILLCCSLALLVGCTKEDDAKKEQEIWVKGYTAFLPTSTYESASVEFLFFNADNEEVFKVDSKIFDGEIYEYQSIEDETFSLLSNGKLSMTDGTIVEAYKIVRASQLSDAYTNLILPIGRYYICAIYQGRTDGYWCLYSKKYAGMYFDVKSKYNPIDISVVFPCDLHRYGHIEWCKWGDSFSYDFSH